MLQSSEIAVKCATEWVKHNVLTIFDATIITVIYCVVSNVIQLTA